MSQTGKKKEPRQSRVKVIWFFLRPYKFQVIALFILAGIAGVLETAAGQIRDKELAAYCRRAAARIKNP